MNQGKNSISIGTKAGSNGGNYSNTIVLNASSDELNPNSHKGLFIEPIRGVEYGIGYGIIVYDSVLKEITYSTT